PLVFRHRRGQRCCQQDGWRPDPPGAGPRSQEASGGNRLIGGSRRRGVTAPGGRGFGVDLQSGSSLALVDAHKLGFRDDVWTCRLPDLRDLDLLGQIQMPDTERRQFEIIPVAAVAAWWLGSIIMVIAEIVDGFAQAVALTVLRGVLPQLSEGAGQI